MSVRHILRHGSRPGGQIYLGDLEHAAAMSEIGERSQPFYDWMRRQNIPRPEFFCEWAPLVQRWHAEARDGAPWTEPILVYTPFGSDLVRPPTPEPLFEAAMAEVTSGGPIRFKMTKEEEEQFMADMIETDTDDESDDDDESSGSIENKES